MLWLADITYLRSWEGWLYLTAVQDAYSRRIVGWSMAERMRSELVTDALSMAVDRRRPGQALSTTLTRERVAVRLASASGRPLVTPASRSRWNPGRCL